MRMLLIFVIVFFCSLLRGADLFGVEIPRKAAAPAYKVFENGKQVSRKLTAAQAWALQEARILASRGTGGHPMGCAPGASFSGTGYGYSRNCNTCTPGRRMVLVADAAVYRRGRWFRSRHWR